jgi:cysteinyl-tRNA synthetase
MIKLYDTRLRQKVDFEPIVPGKVSMYVCGPTVYNRIHIGNARTFISFDMIRRYLTWRGFDVTFVQNVTDVDDKIIKRANEEGRTAAEVAEEYTRLFIQDMRDAGVQDPTIRPKATEEIDTMIALVERLIEFGHAYVAEGDVYFSVRSYPGYGGLSGRNIDEMEGGHRELRADGQGLEERKQDQLDFALWKAAKPGEPAWDSPWGPGRPGWHIECSAMSERYLGLPFDIHGGGADLVFPHHENERAQSECACEGGFANYWMHSGMLQIANAETGEAEKMSKSLNNFLLLYEVLDQVRPEVLRMLTLQSHYRSPLVFGEQRMGEAEAALSRIENAVRQMDWLLKAAQPRGTQEPTAAEELKAVLDASSLNDRVAVLRANFTEAMDDDFNAPAALGEIFSFVTDVNALLADIVELQPEEEPAVVAARDVLVELMEVLGINVAEEAQQSYPAEVVNLAARLVGFEGSDPAVAVALLLEARAEARKAKQWDVADGVRNGLTELGLTIEDTPQGSRVVVA